MTKSRQKNYKYIQIFVELKTKTAIGKKSNQHIHEYSFVAIFFAVFQPRGFEVDYTLITASVNMTANSTKTAVYMMK